MTRFGHLDPDTERSISYTLKHGLRQDAEHIPADTDLWPRLQQVIASSSHQVRHGAMRGIPQQATGLLSHGSLLRAASVIVLCAALLLSAFAFARPLIFSWLGDTGLKAIALRDGTLINRSVTLHGVTLQIEQGYADASRTALTFRINAQDGNRSSVPRLDTAVLVDAQGYASPAIASAQVENQGLIEFAPPPLSALGVEQSLTLIIPTMFLAGNMLTAVNGPWRISFHLRPQAGRSVIFSVPPEKHGGVTIQPIRLDIASSGVRLLIRLSGLRADTNRLSLTHFVLHGDDIVGCPPGGNFCVSSMSSSNDGALLQLHGPDGQALTPAWMGVADAAGQGLVMQPSADQSVGPTGAVVLEALFLTPLQAPHGVAHLTIDQLRMVSDNAPPSAREQEVSGPWTFALALP